MIYKHLFLLLSLYPLNSYSQTTKCISLLSQQQVVMNKDKLLGMSSTEFNETYDAVIGQRQTLKIEGLEGGFPQRHLRLDEAGLTSGTISLLKKALTASFFTYDRALRRSLNENPQNLITLQEFNESHYSNYFNEVVIFALEIKPRNSEGESILVFDAIMGDESGFDGLSPVQSISWVIDQYRDQYSDTHDISQIISVHTHPTVQTHEMPLPFPSLLSASDIRKFYPLLVDRLRSHGLNPDQENILFGAMAFHNPQYYEYHTPEIIVSALLL